MMKIRVSKWGVVVGLAVIGASLSLSVAAADHVGGRVGGGGHAGAHVTPGGGGGRASHDGGHWHGSGWGWWGLGLGLGLGLEAAYQGYPYYVYPYYPYAPPAVIIDQPAPLLLPEGPTVVVPPSPPATANWYYCDSAKRYYPYVTQCPEPWRLVPAVPPGAVH